MSWRPEERWMMPKHNQCINCNQTVDPLFAGYIVYDIDTGEYRRQHVECKAREDKEAEAERMRERPMRPVNSGKPAA